MLGDNSVKISFLLLISALIMLIAGTAGINPAALAQVIMIETSADEHGNTFFGESVLQVVITDPDSNNDSVLEEISVNIEATPQSGPAGSDSIIVPETSDSSGKFELFIAHEDATLIGPADLDADNPSGVEGDGSCIADCSPFVTFGQTGDVNADSSLYEETRFEIIVDDVEIVIDYEETSGTLELDRSSYGSNSFVYITINDQDANLDPTNRDEFAVDPNNDPNDDLFELDGGSFDDAVVFEETGPNTGIFEGRYRLGVSIDANAEALVVTLKENDSNETDAVSFTIGDSDGTIGVGDGDGEQQITTFDPTIATDKESYTEGESVHLTITDLDANANPGMVESIDVMVFSGSSEIEVSLLETSANSGIFEASFMLASESNATEGAIFASNNVTITYTDDRPADYSDSLEAGLNPEKDFELAIDVEFTAKSGTETTKVGTPIVQNMAGSEGPFSVGSSLTLSTNVTNNNNDQQLFVALIEVRDSNDVTVFLSWQTGTLEPRASADIAVSWLSNNVGTYQIRTFTLSSINLEGAEVLSPVATSDIIVR
jgi:hypothetical protein